MPFFRRKPICFIEDCVHSAENDVECKTNYIHILIYCICRPFHTKIFKLKHSIFQKIKVFGSVGTIRSISKLRTSTSFKREWIWTLNQTPDQETGFNILDLNSSFAEFFYQKNSMLLVSLKTISAQKFTAWRGIVEERPHMTSS